MADEGGERRCAALDCDQLVVIAPGATGMARRKRYCSKRCRKRATDHRRKAAPQPLPQEPVAPYTGPQARTAPVLISEAISVRYDDPPYPGKAHLYPEGVEVDPRVEVEELCRESPDGWALSTNAESLLTVLAVCPPGVRVGAWRRGWRPYLERSQSWEPVIFCGGRRSKVTVPDSIGAHVPKDWDLPGQKPKLFFWWVMAMLGLRSGDGWVEPFPGSGTGAEARREYRGVRWAVQKLTDAGSLHVTPPQGRWTARDAVIDANYRCRVCGIGWRHGLEMGDEVVTSYVHCGQPVRVLMGPLSRARRAELEESELAERSRLQARGGSVCGQESMDPRLGPCIRPLGPKGRCHDGDCIHPPRSAVAGAQP